MFIYVPYISATLPVTFGWFVAFRLSDTVCFFGKQRPVLLHLRASSLLCLFQLLIRAHLCLQLTVKDEIWGLSVEKVRDKAVVSAGDCTCLGYLMISLFPALLFKHVPDVLTVCNLKEGEKADFSLRLDSWMIIFLQNLKNWIYTQSPYDYHFKTESLLWNSCWFRVCGLHYVLGGLFTSSVYRSIPIKHTRTHKTHALLVSCWARLSAPTHFQMLV